MSIGFLQTVSAGHPQFTEYPRSRSVSEAVCNIIHRFCLTLDVVNLFNLCEREARCNL